MLTAFITGLAGEVMTADERRFIAETRPAGLILFARNCGTADRIRGLIADFKAAVGSDRVLVLVDQEGGRVQRLKPPLASVLPPAAAYAAHAADDPRAQAAATALVARLAADELRALGFNCDCAPVLDVPVPGAHDIIGSRAFGRDVPTVVRLGRAFAEGLVAGAVLPVMKHIPGHGRALADSHLELPVVDASRETLLAHDLAPFRTLSALPAAMTAHVVYPAFDRAHPASTSAIITRDVIRGACGFDGLLMSDDVAMKALAGPFRARAEAVIAAGSDLALHCSGNLAEMRSVAAGVPALTGPALRRFELALAVTEARPQPYDTDAARRCLVAIMGRGSV